MELFDIVQVKKTANDRVVNELLDSGWVLLSTGFHTGEVLGYDYHSYSLGLPKGVTPISKPKNYPDGVNF
ncbi:hypothetical protein ABZ756_00520 [Mammaliicoccus sciuri]